MDMSVYFKIVNLVNNLNVLNTYCKVGIILIITNSDHKNIQF